MPSRSSTQRSPSKRVRFTSDRGVQHSMTQTSTDLSSDAKCDPWAAMRGVNLLPAAPSTPTCDPLPEPGALRGPHNAEIEVMEASQDTPPKRQSNTIVRFMRISWNHTLTGLVVGTLCEDDSIHGRVGHLGILRAIGRRGATASHGMFAMRSRIWAREEPSRPLSMCRMLAYASILPVVHDYHPRVYAIPSHRAVDG